MRNDPNPRAVLAACLGFPLHELRRAVPYEWRSVAITVTGQAQGCVPELEVGMWFAAGDPVLAIIGVLPEQVIVGFPHGWQTGPNAVTYSISGACGHVRLPRHDPDLRRILPAVVETIATARRRELFPCSGCGETVAPELSGTPTT
jgi:hypothetical protein